MGRVAQHTMHGSNYSTNAIERPSSCSAKVLVNEKSLAVQVLMLANRDRDEMNRRYREESGEATTALEALGGFMERKGYSPPSSGWNQLFCDPTLLEWADAQSVRRGIALTTLYEQLRLGRTHLGLSTDVPEDEADFARYFPAYMASVCARTTRAPLASKSQPSPLLQATVIGVAVGMSFWAFSAAKNA